MRADAPRVLVVDDQIEMAETLCDGLNARGFSATACGSSSRALSLLEKEDIDALITDLRMPDVDGFTLLAHSRHSRPERPVLVMTAFGAIDSAVESIRQGAYHYLTKPFSFDELLMFLTRALEEAKLRRETTALKQALKSRFGRNALIGQSRPMLALLDSLERVAVTDVPLLVSGETGTGKGLCARMVHAESPRGSGPFVSINCGALPENLLESELFGHEKGAFTGATQSRKGLFAEADRGTLFLDEIGELSLPLQVKLLHALEEGYVRPVGANRPIPINVRIIAATHRNLRQYVAQGKFREDLFYRLDVISVEIPALRDRRDDIPLLVEQFLSEQLRRHERSPVRRLAADALAMLARYDWPGNVRELQHLIERVVVLGRHAEISAQDLPPNITAEKHEQTLAFEGPILPVKILHKQYAQWAMAQLAGQRKATADRLGIDVRTLYNWLSEDSSFPA